MNYGEWDRARGTFPDLAMASGARSWADTDHSLELLARYVAPHVTGTASRPAESLQDAIAAIGGAGGTH